MSLQRVPLVNFYESEDSYIYALCPSMIPYLPLNTDELEIPPFYKIIQENLVVRSAHHESWHTHKRDTSVCWICDLLELSKLLISELERNISKSALDLDDQFLAQEFNSEGDTVNYNKDEEVVDGPQDSSVSNDD